MIGMVQAASANDLTNMIAQASRDAPHLVGLLREVQAGRLFIARYQRNVKAPPSALSKQPLPVLIVLSDVEGIPTGPAGWKSAKAAFLWAETIIIYGIAPSEVQYLAIAAASEIATRTVLVECRSDQVAEWKRAAERNRRARVRLIEPPEGEAYPEAVAAGKLQ